MTHSYYFFKLKQEYVLEIKNKKFNAVCLEKQRNL